MTEMGRGVNEAADIPLRRVREGRSRAKAKLGSGKRFASLKTRLAKKRFRKSSTKGK